MYSAPFGSTDEVLMVDNLGCLLFRLCSPGCDTSLRVNLRANVSISLLMFSIVGGGGVGEKFSPFRSKFVSDRVSWRLDRFTIRLSKIVSICLDLLGIVFFGPFILKVHFRSKVELP